jgi:hypothetical protein
MNIEKSTLIEQLLEHFSEEELWDILNLSMLHQKLHNGEGLTMMEAEEYDDLKQKLDSVIPTGW